MTRTVLIVELTHDKPLPDKTPLTDVLANRISNYIYSHGVQVGVTVKLADTLEVKDMS